MNTNKNMFYIHKCICTSDEVSCMKTRNFKDPYSNCEIQKVEELEATQKDLEATLQESQGDNRCDHVLSSLVLIMKPLMSQLYPTP